MDKTSELIAHLNTKNTNMCHYLHDMKCKFGEIAGHVFSKLVICLLHERW